ncbi:MAG: MATE family efflux transporter [Bacteroidales bacterium]|nr:MATE family efflux transporter [Candidatus Cryptobacteroides faecihippi]
MQVELSGHYGYGRIVRTMFPMVMMMIVISIYSIVDGFFISNYAGSTAFAGMNLIWPAIALVGALGMMVGSGGSALVSKTLGEGDPERARQVFSMLIRVTIAAGVVLAVLLFIFMPQVASFLGSDDEMMPYAVSYGRILITVLPGYMLQTAFQPFFMAAEKPELGTRLSIICGVTNILLDALFVAVFGWGLTGAAWASSIGLLVGGFYPLWYFSSKKNATQLWIVPCGLDWKSILKSCTNGLSEFVGNIALNIIGICYNWQLMAYIGADGVSAYGIIMYLGFIFAAVFIGYNMGITQIIAYNYGAGNHQEMRSLLHKSIVLALVFGFLLVGAAELTAPAVVKVFVGYDKVLSDISLQGLRIYMLSFLICGVNMFTSAWFTALNNGTISAAAAFLRTLVFEMAAVFALPPLFGVDGIWMSVNVAEVLSLIVSIALIASFRKRYEY